MSALRTIAEMMKADVRERTRRYSFLVTIAATLYLGYLINEGTIRVSLGRAKAAPNAAWTGVMMALCTITFVCLVGFYVVKNAVERDRETGVGQILAGTRVSTALYLFGKTLSNFVVLAIVTGILALAAVLMQLFGGRDFDIGALLGPFLLLALPAMFFVGALAVFFESVKLLRGIFGNIVFFLAFSGLIMLPMLTGIMASDLFGLKLAMDEIQRDVRASVPDYNGEFSIGSGAKIYPDAKEFTWGGITWTGSRIGWRMLPFAYGAALFLLGALLFDRFSEAAQVRKKGRIRIMLGRLGGKRLGAGAFTLPVGKLTDGTAYGRILVAELRLMLQGRPWWWYGVALALWTSSLATDPEFSRLNLLPWLWVWPALLWSGLGARERRFRTGSVLWSSPRPLGRQLPAAWGAGVLVALLFASGLVLRLAAAGDLAPVPAILVGSIFIPSFALALGIWSGSGKPFEALYLLLWYLGPLHHTPPIDFMGTTDAAIAAGSPVAFALASAVLLLVALEGRRRQIAGA